MSWRILLVIGAVLAVAFAGLALYSSDRVDACVRTETYSDPQPRGGSIVRERCLEEKTVASPPSAEAWWWFSGIAVVVLTLAAVPLVARRSS